MKKRTPKRMARSTRRVNPFRRPHGLWPSPLRFSSSWSSDALSFSSPKYWKEEVLDLATKVAVFTVAAALEKYHADGSFQHGRICLPWALLRETCITVGAAISFWYQIRSVKIQKKFKIQKWWATEEHFFQNITFDLHSLSVKSFKI